MNDLLNAKDRVTLSPRWQRGDLFGYVSGVGVTGVPVGGGGGA